MDHSNCAAGIESAKFTGNIGLHHIRHLNPRIPNYRLQSYQDGVAELHDIPVMTFGSAFGAIFYVLWDEERQRMVTLRAAGAGQLNREPAR